LAPGPPISSCGGTRPFPQKEEAALHDSQAVHRVVADGISPEQAVDEAVARIKQILSE
jgi:hypothetical protein